MASFLMNEGFDKKELLWLIYVFPREAKFTSSNFFASKDVMGGSPPFPSAWKKHPLDHAHEKGVISSEQDKYMLILLLTVCILGAL